MENQLSFFTLGDKPVKEVDANGNPVRKRQQHRKSRNGCKECKRRKVKCDESSPACENCTKRNLNCSFLQTKRPVKQLLTHSTPSNCLVCGNSPPPVSPPSSVTDDGYPKHDRIFFSDRPENIGLILRRSPAERELFIRFERVTSKTMAMTSLFWDKEVLEFALQDDYVMNALLLVAASHVNYFLPPGDPSRLPVLHYYANALTGLRLALAEELTLQVFDAIFTASLMLIQYSWTHIDFCPNLTNTDSDIAAIFIETVGFFHGLRACIFTQPEIFFSTKWRKVMKYSPRAALEDYVLKYGDKTEFERMFDHLMFCGVGSRTLASYTVDNMTTAARLVVPLQAIKLGRPEIQKSEVLPDLRRFLFTWPTFCTDGFLQQVKDQNPTSMVLLLYYYAAIMAILSDDLWWMQDRATYMYNLLKTKLEGRCDRCTGPAFAICAPNYKPFSWESPMYPSLEPSIPFHPTPRKNF